MQRLRSDIWCAAFVRRHNDLGRMCVIARRGDPVAGQIWVEVDHLNGTSSLFVPAPSATSDGLERTFQLRYDKVEPLTIRERIAREVDFDPDLWVIALDLRNGDPGLEVVNS
ncbi:DUF1491 family protein [Pelagibacterium halotolerans]|uniref:DUF1491 family protein n=1 Tax=Pelagibacterium halotolerans TaxID=531813 RepID=UPI00384AB37A